ncbi:uncharacterized protein LOC580878 [Strongylocentrotus purpuratus]|uniref:ZU5 domain-containing protein n=1 Tax=Strongylocentrotus purpuratus TaxID=7668 RepID=A0A7M7NET6_STRPU|nr:uncharacterized protein LOC580878 [Strongylocentrotus purpuratus]
MPITTDTNARMQMIKMSISATSTNQPNTSMAFVAIRTGFSTDILSTLDEMVPGSNTDLSHTEDTPSYEFITKEINTDQYYHLGLALGLSYQTLDSIQFRSRHHEEAGVNTLNPNAAVSMIRYWKCLLHSVSLADDHLREVWMSVIDSGDLTPVLEQGRRAEKPETDSKDVFEEEVLREESRTAPTVGLHALGSEITQGQWGGRVYEGRTRTPSIRSDSVSSLSTVLDDEYQVSLHGEEVGYITRREPRRTNRPDGSRTHGDYLGFRQQNIPEDHDYQDWQLAMSASKTNTQQEADSSEQAITSPGIETRSELEFPPICQKGDDSTDEDEQLQVLHTLSSDKYHSEGIFDQTGGELLIPSYGLTLSVPPGALPEGSSETITLDVLTDIPPEITLRDDETVVTYGFQCLPSGLQFESAKPVRLKMPHCANLIDPTKVQVVVYSLNHGKAKA